MRAGKQAVQGVEINGVIPEISYLPLSHGVGNYIHLVSIKDRDISLDRASSGCEP